MVSECDAAPDFELVSDAGETVRLSGPPRPPRRPLLLPRDETPACTAQACGFCDVYDRFAEQGAVVFGVSPDTEESHVRSKEKYDLPFTLLADPEEAAQAYGVWGERKLYGKTSMGITRSTFVIGPDATIAKAMRGVKPEGHPAQVLAALPR